MLARQGLILPRDGEPGLRIFENEKPGGHPAGAKAQLQRGRCRGSWPARSRCLTAIEFARVHIVRRSRPCPPQRPEGQRLVMVRMKPAAIQQHDRRGDHQLCVGGRRGTQPEQVTRRRHPGTNLQPERRRELWSSAERRLSHFSPASRRRCPLACNGRGAVLGPDRSTVLAKAVVDMSSETRSSAPPMRRACPARRRSRKLDRQQETISDGEGGPSRAGVTEKTSTTTRNISPGDGDQPRPRRRGR